MVSARSDQVASAGRALVIFPGALGDLICFGPALRALARRHRDARPGAGLDGSLKLGLELMAREELARFAVARLAIARDHSRAHSIDRTRAFAARSKPPPRPEPSAFTPFVPRARTTSPPATLTR